MSRIALSSGAAAPGARPGLSVVDLVGLGVFGLRTRPTRVVLSALGIAIGIAAMIAVVGISSSSKAALDRVLDGLGTNVLTATAPQAVGTPEPLPTTALDSALRQPVVQSAASVGRVDDVGVYRNPFVPEAETKGIGTMAARGDLPAVLGGSVAGGRWLDRSPDAPDQVVLGAAAATALGVDVRGGLDADARVWIAGRWVPVVGVLDPLLLASDLDTQLFMTTGLAVGLGFDGHPSAVHARVDPERVAASRDLLTAAIAPGQSGSVAVSRPSDALAAKDATDDSFTGLLVGIGGVALLVGGIGVANTMVITVLERRAEIGVRRALGARRRNIRDQFLVESLLLSFVGGIAGVVLGAGVTTVFALAQGAPVTIPPWALGGGLASTVVIGGVAGLWPAARAARIPPTTALAAA